MELPYKRANARVGAIGGTAADRLGTLVSWLVRQQYSVGYVCIVARHAAAFGRWCEGRGVGLDSLADNDIARYQRNRDRCRSRLADSGAQNDRR
jgi:integrase/recombinase XerD